MTISHGVQGDLHEIIQLTRACAIELTKNGVDQWDENYPDSATIENDIQNGQLYTCRKNDKISGIIVLNEVQDEEYGMISWLTDVNSKNLIIHRLAVHPDDQGQGIASRLMDFAENFAQQKKYTSIRLDTFSRNEYNQKFYLNRGYAKLGEVYLKYRDDYPYFCFERLMHK